MRKIFPLLIGSLGVASIPFAPGPSQAAGEYEEVPQASDVGEPIPGLSREDESLHIRGRRLFRWSLWRPDRTASGFNQTDCSVCHIEPIFGGSSSHRANYVTFVPDKSERTGMRVYHRMQRVGDGRFTPVDPPSFAKLRRAPAMFGLGLLEAIPDEAIKNFADPSDNDKDGISGRWLIFNGKLARFGWKPNVGSIDEFTKTAFLNELGMTALKSDPPDFVSRIGPGQMDAVTYYSRTLAPAPSILLPKLATSGGALFTRLRCDSCHTPTQRTGEFPISALKKKTIHPYTDLLVHQIEPNSANHTNPDFYEPGEYRTAPLWGLGRFAGPFWHDGSAPTVDAAIRLHDGEAKASKEAYGKLEQVEKDLLIRFLQAL